MTNIGYFMFGMWLANMGLLLCIFAALVWHRRREKRKDNQRRITRALAPWLKSRNVKEEEW